LIDPHAFTGPRADAYRGGDIRHPAAAFFFGEYKSFLLQMVAVMAPDDREPAER
jgi:hypothetical protein